MSNVLFITTVYRTGEKIHPVIPALAEHCIVDVMNLLQMSDETPWVGTEDPRERFWDMCEEVCDKVFYGPKFVDDNDTNGKVYGEFVEDLDSLLPRGFYDLVILDNNITIKGSQLAEFYDWFHKQGVPVIACPHGNRDPKGYRIISRLGRMFDKSFVFGEKEKDTLIHLEKKPYRYRKSLLCGGIPSNDKLGSYKRRHEYILVIPNITEPKQIKGPIKGFVPFTKKTFDSLNLLKLADHYKCGIVIKEKNKMFHRSTRLQDDLKGYDNVDIIMDCKDKNELIAGAICVVSAPSTLAFKPIQMGIPTAILKGHGMTGNFHDFPGFIDCDAGQIRKTLVNQEQNGICADFIKRTLTGGLDFESTKTYVRAILSALKEKEDES